MPSASAWVRCAPRTTPMHHPTSCSTWPSWSGSRSPTDLGGRRETAVDVHLLEVASGVFHVRAQHVGWVMITEGNEVTLVDTGYPGDRERLLRSLRRIGRRPSDVAAILLTHA